VTNESNRNKNQNRWQELAEQLGMADSSPVQPAGKASEAPPAPEPRLERPVSETAPKKHLESPDPDAFVSVVEESVSAEFTKVPQTESEADLDEPMSDQGEIESDEGPAEEAPASGQEEGSPSGRTSGRRRRRRRSSKKKNPAMQAEGAVPGPEGEAITPEPAAAAAEAPAMAAEAASGSEAGRAPDQEATKERGRSRGRNGQRRREREREPVEESSSDEDEVHESGGAVGIDEDGEEEEVANYSNWTVPSWKDLIASLYRPDR
jgi:hypothetical protein